MIHTVHWHTQSLIRTLSTFLSVRSTTCRPLCMLCRCQGSYHSRRTSRQRSTQLSLTTPTRKFVLLQCQANSTQRVKIESPAGELLVEKWMQICLFVSVVSKDLSAWCFWLVWLQPFHVVTGLFGSFVSHGFVLSIYKQTQFLYMYKTVSARIAYWLKHIIFIARKNISIGASIFILTFH